jgi:hypothetical protein
MSYGPNPVPLEERFWRYVAIGDDCWTWTGSLAGRYGVLRGPKRTRLYAHRLSYEIHNGPIPEGLCILHSCDNPLCVNPAHLRVGTMADNMKDCVKRGRRPRGEKCSYAKLTQSSVDLIRRQARNGIPQKTLATQFGVSKSLICQIVNRKVWTH